MRPFVYRVFARDQQPDLFLDCVSGVIHIGANTGQERDLYRSKNLQVLWVEPIPAVHGVLESNLTRLPSSECSAGTALREGWSLTVIEYSE